MCSVFRVAAWSYSSAEQPALWLSSTSQRCLSTARHLRVSHGLRAVCAFTGRGHFVRQNPQVVFFSTDELLRRLRSENPAELLQQFRFFVVDDLDQLQFGPTAHMLREVLTSLVKQTNPKTSTFLFTCSTTFAIQGIVSELEVLFQVFSTFRLVLRPARGQLSHCRGQGARLPAERAAGRAPATAQCGRGGNVGGAESKVNLFHPFQSALQPDVFDKAVREAENARLEKKSELELAKFAGLTVLELLKEGVQPVVVSAETDEQAQQLFEQLALGYQLNSGGWFDCV